LSSDYKYQYMDPSIDREKHFELTFLKWYQSALLSFFF
jgi:hypothetical protein